MSAGRKGDADIESGRVAPGVHLRAELQRLGLDQVAVSKATGVSRQSVNNVINGRQAISRAMAGKLGRLTGHSSDYWLSESFTAAELAASPEAVPARFATAGILVNHQILRAVNDGIIGIEPFVLRNLQAASIILSLNNSVSIAAGDSFDIGGGKSFDLEPGHSVNATTMERIDLPQDYVGRIGADTRLCDKGVIAAGAFQIEPGFKGRLGFCLFNAGSRPFRLSALDPVLGLEIIRLGAASDRGPAT